MKIKITMRYHDTPWYCSSENILTILTTDENMEPILSLFSFVGGKRHASATQSFLTTNRWPSNPTPLCVFFPKRNRNFWSHSNFDMDVGSSSMQKSHNRNSAMMEFPFSKWMDKLRYIHRVKSTNYRYTHTAMGMDLKSVLQSVKCQPPKLHILKRQDCSNGELVNSAKSRDRGRLWAKEELEGGLGGRWLQWWQRAYFIV